MRHAHDLTSGSNIGIGMPARRNRDSTAT